MNIARKKKLELPKSEHFMLQVRNEAMNENGTKEKESNSSYKGQQKYSAPSPPVNSYGESFRISRLPFKTCNAKDSVLYERFREFYRENLKDTG